MASILEDNDSKSGSVGIKIANKAEGKAIIDALEAANLEAIYATLKNESLQPASINAYLRYFNLDDTGKGHLVDAFKEAVGAGKEDRITKENVIDILLNSKKAKAAFQSAKTPFVERQLQVNPNDGLSLALINPIIAQIINDERARKAKLMLVRTAAIPSMHPFGGLIGNPAGISIRFGGAAVASAMQPPSFKYPIEMRGGGYDIAMSGGNHFAFLQTPNNTYFISTQLRSALNTLRATLRSQDKELSKENDVQVENLLKGLKDAEDKVIEERNNLNRLISGVRSGDVKLKEETGVDVRADENGNNARDEQNIQVVKRATVTAASTAYNAAVLNARKIEKKLFNVIIAIGGQQVYPRRG